MATRQEVQSRKALLKKALREQCSNGTLRPATLAPSKRQLASEFDVSSTIVAQVMQELVEEGLFNTVARSGTYVGAPRPMVRERYVFLCGTEATPVRFGFEDRIAQLGGAVLALGQEQAQACQKAGSWPATTGAVEWGHRLELGEWARLCGRVPVLACYATLESEAETRDSVAFNDEDGGRQATEHLLHLGHHSIAFLGLHEERETSTSGGAQWSRLRERGWRQALREAGLERDDLMVYASRTTNPVSHPEHVEVARMGARLLAHRSDIDAVVTANDRAAQALLEELRAAHVSPRRWPAIVSFDADPRLQSESITSLRLSWEDVGKTLADLLWERSHGELPVEPQHRLVKMRLIPRLTCQPNWTGFGIGSALVDGLVFSAAPSSQPLSILL